MTDKLAACAAAGQAISIQRNDDEYRPVGSVAKDLGITFQVVPRVAEKADAIAAVRKFLGMSGSTSGAAKRASSVWTIIVSNGMRGTPRFEPRRSITIIRTVPMPL
jgi:hypothetical protein